jgi:hypothetical protein
LTLWPQSFGGFGSFDTLLVLECPVSGLILTGLGFFHSSPEIETEAASDLDGICPGFLQESFSILFHHNPSLDGKPLGLLVFLKTVLSGA